ncbi:hypothetical protein [Litorimonas sp. WD9-15]|uniref:hypothetical protein n=1 Tax=Litorimonas sp. WD9-15 TaxID=3418716 RepID=UPI003CFF14B1
MSLKTLLVATSFALVSTVMYNSASAQSLETNSVSFVKIAPQLNFSDSLASVSYLSVIKNLSVINKVDEEPETEENPGDGFIDKMCRWFTGESCKWF